jgi:nitronate monooxygenase
MRRLTRGIYNRVASEMKAHEAQFAKYPAHGWIVAPLRAAALAQGRHDLWAGQAAPLCRHHMVGELFVSLVRETHEILRKISDGATVAKPKSGSAIA